MRYSSDTESKTDYKNSGMFLTMSKGNTTSFGNVTVLGRVITHEERLAKHNAEKIVSLHSVPVVEIAKEQKVIKNTRGPYNKNPKPSPKSPLHETLAFYFSEMLASDKPKIDYFRLEKRANLDKYLKPSEKQVLGFIAQATILSNTGMAFLTIPNFINGLSEGNDIFVEGINKTGPSISEAIKSLIDKNIILKYKFNNSNILYLLNLPKSNEILSLIKEGKLTEKDCKQLNKVLKIRNKENGSFEKTFFKLDLSLDYLSFNDKKILLSQQKNFIAPIKKLNYDNKKILLLKSLKANNNQKILVAYPRLLNPNLLKPKFINPTTNRKQKIKVRFLSDVVVVFPKSLKNKIEEKATGKSSNSINPKKIKTESQSNLTSSTKKEGSAAGGENVDKSPEIVDKENNIIAEFLDLNISRDATRGYIDNHGLDNVIGVLNYANEQEQKGKIRNTKTDLICGILNKEAGKVNFATQKKVKSEPVKEKYSELYEYFINKKFPGVTVGSGYSNELNNRNISEFMMKKYDNHFENPSRSINDNDRQNLKIIFSEIKNTISLNDLKVIVQEFITSHRISYANEKTMAGLFNLMETI